jgi:hypothetical protein
LVTISAVNRLERPFKEREIHVYHSPSKYIVQAVDAGLWSGEVDESI